MIVATVSIVLSTVVFGLGAGSILWAAAAMTYPRPLDGLIPPAGVAVVLLVVPVSIAIGTHTGRPAARYACFVMTALAAIAWLGSVVAVRFLAGWTTVLLAAWRLATVLLALNTSRQWFAAERRI